tara:strand:+ start:376 stop:558 length:183 start_codon:yes stop_codon:yes gene_type:complete
MIGTCKTNRGSIKEENLNADKYRITMERFFFVFETINEMILVIQVFSLLDTRYFRSTTIK